MMWGQVSEATLANLPHLPLSIRVFGDCHTLTIKSRKAQLNAPIMISTWVLVSRLLLR
jgi:hypothetical protein